MSDQPSQKQKLSDKPAKFNVYAIAGFVLALISLPGPFPSLAATGIIPVLAVIFSSIGLSQINRKKMRGRALAIIGIILGVLNTFYFIFLIWASGEFIFD